MSNSLIEDKRGDKCVFLCFLQEEQLTLQREDNQQLISEVSCFITAQLEDFWPFLKQFWKIVHLFVAERPPSAEGQGQEDPEQDQPSTSDPPGYSDFFILPVELTFDWYLCDCFSLQRDLEVAHLELQQNDMSIQEVGGLIASLQQHAKILKFT